MGGVTILDFVPGLLDGDPSGNWGGLAQACLYNSIQRNPSRCKGIHSSINSILKEIHDFSARSRSIENTH